VGTQYDVFPRAYGNKKYISIISDFTDQSTIFSTKFKELNQLCQTIRIIRRDICGIAQRGMKISLEFVEGG
jgi:hypothetical protein